MDTQQIDVMVADAQSEKLQQFVEPVSQSVPTNMSQQK